MSSYRPSGLVHAVDGAAHWLTIGPSLVVHIDRLKTTHGERRFDPPVPLWQLTFDRDIPDGVRAALQPVVEHCRDYRLEQRRQYFAELERLKRDASPQWLSHSTKWRTRIDNR